MALNHQDSSKAVVTTIPDAVIFIPGLTHESSRYPIDEISLLLANALDNADSIAKAKFRVGEVKSDALAKSGDSQTATIFREQDGQEAPVVKVYGMNYNSEILDRFQGLPPIVKFLSLPLTILPLVRAWNPFTSKKGLSGRERWQFFILSAALLLLFVYGFLLITSVLGSFGALRPDSANDNSASYPSEVNTPPITEQSDRSVITRLQEWWANRKEALLALAPRFVVLATLLGLVIPTRAQVTEALENGATILMAMIQYHWLGLGRPRVRGQLTSLMQDILEAPETADARIHILTHSFGSIVAMDTLFRSDMAPPASFGRIRSLVTIGSPFDFIYMMWPRYFDNRQKTAGLRWINIFAPQDVLSSNFLEESKARTLRNRKSKSSQKSMETPSVAGLVPDLNLVYRPTDTGDELGVIDIITLVGLRAHILYWERGKKSHSNAFELAVPEMFATTAAP